MSNSTCGHCGARLPAPTGGGASLIRCKTCGRRAVAANQASQDAALPPRRRSQPGDVPPSEAVNGAEDPLLQGSLVTHRVPAEEVSGTIRPRPDLLHDVGPDPDRRRKVVVAIVLAVAALCSVGTAVFLTLRQPQRQQQRQDAQVFVIATPPGTPNYPGPGPNGQGTPVQPVSTPLPPPPAAPAPPTPPAPPQSPASPTSLASSIEASNDLCNSSIFLSSEVALREFEDLYPRLKPDAVHAELKAILGELGKDGVNEFELLSRIRAVQASEWLRWYRPAFTVLFRSQIKQPVGAEVRVACKDAFAKSLFVGGLSSRPDAKLAWNPADGTAQLPFQLGLDPSAIYDLKAPLNVNLEFQVEYEDGSRETPIRHEVRVHPVGYVELGYPFGYSFAAIVDEDHPMVKDLINKISSSSLCRRTDVAMGEGGVDLRAMFLVWRELRARGIHYSNIAKTGTPLVQEVRLIDESIRGGGHGQANCADGSVLLASILQKIGCAPNLVRVPGHMFLMFRFPIEGDWLGLETTALQDGDPCSEQFHDFILQDPKLRDFEGKLSGNDRTEWLSFLRALQIGTDLVSECREAIFRGLPAGKGGLYEQGTAPASAYLAALATAIDAGNHDEAKNLLAELGTRYLDYCDINEARKQGVRPVGHDPTAMPSDLSGPLRAP